ncbi:MAG: RNA polymerase sigma factor [Pirellulales bacterium]
MDQHEFARQFAVAYPRLWFIATSLVGNRADAEDLVQDAAVIAYRKLDSFERGSNFTAWLARIVRFCAANHRRKTGGRRVTATDPNFLEQQAAGDQRTEWVDPLGWVQKVPGADGPPTSWRGMSELVDDNMLRAINQLAPEVRACLLLRVVDERSYAEIAELLEIPAGTAMSHVHRAKQRLRDSYQGDWGDSNRRGDRAGGSR